MHGVHINSKKINDRIRKIKGQIGGIEKMVEKNAYCIDIITQTSAIKNAISALEDAMLESHLEHCLVSSKNREKLDEMREEIIRVYKLKRK